MTKFSDLKLDPKVLQAITEAGYETPTPIQVGAIPPALEGRDVLGIAQTGTGKTAGFVLPMITLLGRGRARARMPRSLVLCPTRELAAQVAENFDIYAKHTRLTKALLIGGVSFGEQDKLIDRGVDVLIATPGRLLDHFERGKLLLTGVQIMVVDEADRMLDMGFIPDIERIFQLTPFTRQTLFFSATMAPEIERITNTFLHAPERIEVARQATTSETITQKLVELTPTRKDQSAKQKRELLRALIDAEGEALKNAIIFCNRKTDVDIVAKSLKAHGYDAAPIHGDLDQRVRMATLDGFRDGSLRFLVASDVAARGLDIPAVSHVFNFDLPSHAEDYVHRIGRTGRAGRQGTAISISTPADEKYLSAIESLVKQTLPRAEVPEGFRLSDAAQRAPRPAAERGVTRGAPARSRSRRGGLKEPAREASETAQPVSPPSATPAPEAPRTPAPHPERNGERSAEQRGDRATEPRRSSGHGNGNGNGNGSAQPGSDGRHGSDRSDHRRDDRRDRYHDRGPAVAGMGDHVPDFMRTSFTEALAITEARMASRSQSEPQPADEDNAAATETPAATGQTSGRSRSRSRSRSKDRPTGQAATEAATESAAVEPQPEAAPPEAALEAAPEVATGAALAETAGTETEATKPVATEAAPPVVAAEPPLTEAPALPLDPAPDTAPTEAPAPAEASAEAPAGEALPPVESKAEAEAEAVEKPKRTRRTTTAKPAAATAKAPSKTTRTTKAAAKEADEAAAKAAPSSPDDAAETPEKPAAKPRTRKAPAKTPATKAATTRTTAKPAAKSTTRSTAKKAADDAGTGTDAAADGAGPAGSPEDTGPAQG